MKCPSRKGFELVGSYDPQFNNDLFFLISFFSAIFHSTNPLDPSDSQAINNFNFFLTLSMIHPILGSKNQIMTFLENYSRNYFKKFIY